MSAVTIVTLLVQIHIFTKIVAKCCTLEAENAIHICQARVGNYCLLGFLNSMVVLGYWISTQLNKFWHTVDVVCKLLQALIVSKKREYFS